MNIANYIQLAASCLFLVISCLLMAVHFKKNNDAFQAWLCASLFCIVSILGPL